MFRLDAASRRQLQLFTSPLSMAHWSIQIWRYQERRQEGCCLFPCPWPLPEAYLLPENQVTEINTAALASPHILSNETWQKPWKFAALDSANSRAFSQSRGERMTSRWNGNHTIPSCLGVCMQVVPYGHVIHHLVAQNHWGSLSPFQRRRKMEESQPESSFPWH